eukprot:TRINITY_DN954_c0_g1_i4.p1 TRINITY_DN954_c0_g1~~TRINITY_DN954_c0_g1_i4.p1  ORF type:complete len:492 (+),score=169.51 TRINITY_DN954_c0_g1_i4:112-1587(+)
MNSDDNVQTMMEEVKHEMEMGEQTIHERVMHAMESSAANMTDPFALMTNDTIHNDPHYRDAAPRRTEGVGWMSSISDTLKHSLSAVSDPVVLATGSTATSRHETEANADTLERARSKAEEAAGSARDVVEDAVSDGGEKIDDMVASISDTLKHSLSAVSDPVVLATGSTATSRHDEQERSTLERKAEEAAKSAREVMDDAARGTEERLESARDKLKEGSEKMTSISDTLKHSLSAVSDPVVLATGSTATSRHEQDHDMLQRAQNKAEEAAENAREVVEDAASATEERLEVVRDKLEEGAEMVKEAAGDAMDAAELMKQKGVGRPKVVVPGVTPTKMVNPTYSEVPPMNATYISSQTEATPYDRSARTQHTDLLEAGEQFGAHLASMATGALTSNDRDLEQAKRWSAGDGEPDVTVDESSRGIFDHVLLGTMVAPKPNGAVDAVADRIEEASEKARELGGKLHERAGSLTVNDVHFLGPGELVSPSDNSECA